jgi:hypothetical protein
MDVDTPGPSTTTAPSITEEAKVNASSPPKAAPAPGQVPEDTEYLKVNFEDLKIQDLITSLNLPRAPAAPRIPAALLPPTVDTRDAYLDKFKSYMGEWDLFNSRMMLHLLERKKQNDALGATRWLNSDGISYYRKGLQEDAAVLKWWNDAMERHCENMKECQVLQDAANASHADPARANNGQTSGA